MKLTKKVTLYGGPLDGFTGTAEIIEREGRLPLLVHRPRNSRYLYRARQLLQDSPSPIPMYFVQVLSSGDEP